MSKIAYLEVKFHKYTYGDGIGRVSYYAKQYERYVYEDEFAAEPPVLWTSNILSLSHPAREIIHRGDKSYVQVLLLEDKRNTDGLQWIEVPSGFGSVYKVSVDKKYLHEAI